MKNFKKGDAVKIKNYINEAIFDKYCSNTLYCHVVFDKKYYQNPVCCVTQDLSKI